MNNKSVETDGIQPATDRQHVRNASMDVQQPTQIKSILDRYVVEFREHQTAVKAHLKGNLANDLPLSPSLIFPASYWTATEKDLFFHGLTVYSRLQPELIAQSIKTKTTFDVCVYLDALTKAAELIVDDDEDCFEIEIGGVVQPRTLIDPAMELSEEWIQHEETIAGILTEVDACPCSLEVPSEGAPSKQSTKACTCPLNRLGGDEEMSTTNPTLHEKRKRYLNHLDPTCLTVLDRIIHEGRLPVMDVVGPPQESMDVQAREPTLLSPNSAAASKREADQADKEQRRKLQKRLYMRRKRAEAAGKQADLASEKLRPGRLATSHKPRKRRPKMYHVQRSAEVVVDDSLLSIGSDSEGDDANGDSADQDGEVVSTPTSSNGERSRESSKRPRSRQEKTEKTFNDAGINAQSVLEMDLDFFHLSSLAEVLSLNNVLNGLSGKHSEISIAFDCIPLLKAIVKEFVSEIVRRAIILKEQETRIKAKIKAWKYDPEEICAENVMACLRSLGLEELSKENYFTELLAQRQDAYCADQSMEEEPDTASVDDEEPSEESAQPDQSWIPLPLVSFSGDPTWIYPDFSSDDILSSDLDESALKMELDEEERLNTQDEKLSKQYERDLWKSHVDIAR